MLSADNIANLRAHGIPVHGPPPREVLPEVTPDDVRMAVREMLYDVVEECATEEEAAAELLELLRSVRAVETGEPTTKTEGAEWGLEHLDPTWHRAIRRAIAYRNGEEMEPHDTTLRDALRELTRRLRPDQAAPGGAGQA